MTRGLSATLLSEIGAEHNTSTHLLEFTYWDGAAQQTLYYTTASQDITTSGVTNIPDATWIALGFPGGGSALALSEARETSRSASQGVTLRLDGVDQTIVSILLNNQFRGQPAKIYRLYLDESAGTPIGGLLVWSGLQNDDYRIDESRPQDTDEPGTVTIQTKVVSFTAKMQESQPVATNTVSHNSMLDRAGLSTGDTFFQNVTEITDREIFWGAEGPAEESRATSRGRGGGGRAGESPSGPRKT